MSLLRALGPFARGREAALPGERCELCGQELAERHDHLVDLEKRALACSCRPCALLFEKPGAARGRYRSVPSRVLADPSLSMDEARWAQLKIPVRLAFVFRPSNVGRLVALYPGPGGTTESELPDDALASLSSEPLLSAMEPDVEALLAWGPRGAATFHCLLVPISACYELTGRLRRSWRGMSGGDDAQKEIESFFAALQRQSRTLRRGGT